MTGLEGLLAGRTLGDRYRVEEVIGRGGMGAVYRAVDERLGRQVALKIITLAGAADPEQRARLRARFQREARAAAGLPHHPNVVPVYDYGTDPALELDYIVMELLRGSDLATRLARSGPPPVPTALKILYEASQGVAVGHRAGLIHRDIKPGNLFLAETDHADVQVRVLDFGIAKLADDQETATQLTQDGRVPHSPAYASPEQLRGLQQLTPASDVFSLGAVGFQLLTGERAFSDADRNRLSLGMPVPPPSLSERRPDIPESAARAVEQALSFDARDRQQDAVILARELGQALRALPDAPLETYLQRPSVVPPPPPAADDRTLLATGEEDDDRTLVASPPPSPRAGGRAGKASIPPRRSSPPPARKRNWAGTLLWMMILLLLAAAGLWIWAESDGEPRRRRPVVDIPPPPDTLPTITTETTVAETLGTQPGLDAVVHNQEGLRLFRAGDLAGALEQFQLARDLVPENADYAYNYALAVLRTQGPEAAIGPLLRAIELAPERADAYYNLGLASLELGDTAAAWTALQRVPELTDDPVKRAAAVRRLRQIERAQAPPPAVDSLPGTEVVPATPADTVRTRPGTGRPDSVPARRDTASPRRDTLQGRRGQPRERRDTLVRESRWRE